MRTEISIVRLSNSSGSVLDPVVSIRYRVTLNPEQSATVHILTGVSQKRESALELVKKYRDQLLADRVFDLAWTHGQVMLRQVNITEAEAQLYSRLGFSHRYRALGREELLFVLDRHWKRPGRTLDPDDFTDAQAIAAIERITRGNFRLLERLFPQIARVLKINQLETITDDVIESAASILVIGN